MHYKSHRLIVLIDKSEYENETLTLLLSYFIYDTKVKRRFDGNYLQVEIYLQVFVGLNEKYGL